jgi:predicted phosphodiesterase
MKIQYVSDLHLEFKENTQFLKENPLEVKGDLLIIAGDSTYLDTPTYLSHPFWSWASKNYKDVIVCLGNHEFYQYYDIALLQNGFCGEIKPNVHFYYNSVIHYGDIDIIVSTLWGHINPCDAYVTEHSVSDFYRIRCNQFRLTADTFNAENEKCVTFIKQAVQQSVARIKIVVTHHVPTQLAVAEEFINSSINGVFTCDLSNFITDSDIDYWIYGHSHRNIDCVLGKTKIVSNQLGYVFNGEHLNNGFDGAKYFEIEL